MGKIGNQKIWSYFGSNGKARPAASLTIRAAAAGAGGAFVGRLGGGVTGITMSPPSVAGEMWR